MRRVLMTALAGAAIGSATPAAAAITFNGTNGTLSAAATFDVNASGHLIVSLANTAAGDANVPTDILHALFFDIAGSPSLTYTAANICGSCSFTQSGPTGTDVGAEWGYISNASGIGGGISQDYGLSSAGYGLPGTYAFVPGATNQPSQGTPPDGADYGLVPLSYTVAGDNGGVTANQPYINNSVVFDLGAFNGSLADIGNIRFQYGTAITDTHFTPSVPEPATWAMMLLGFGGIGMTMRARRKNGRLLQIA
ncbi:XDD4 family exosortase-dependent surface protein [Sphingomonas agri]|uniref:XDD4 family exosortase-dependent surface protein n=1 Tax=Sphingomonas agri TaxID=1813878 RepID=UPI00311F35C7